MLIFSPCLPQAPELREHGSLQCPCFVTSLGIRAPPWSQVPMLLAEVGSLGGIVSLRARGRDSPELLTSLLAPSACLPSSLRHPPPCPPQAPSQPARWTSALENAGSIQSVDKPWPDPRSSCPLSLPLSPSSCHGSAASPLLLLASPGSRPCSSCVAHRLSTTESVRLVQVLGVSKP